VAVNANEAILADVVTIFSSDALHGITVDAGEHECGRFVVVSAGALGMRL